MILDGHIHLWAGEPAQGELASRMAEAGVGGGVLLSLPPRSYGGLRDKPLDSPERLDHLLAWTSSATGVELFPLFWIDPLEKDAVGQVDRAVERGVAGFKVICSNHRPGDPRAMPVYRAIAETGRPILFHSGILWDGRPSSAYSRPVEFEALLDVPGLRFALAHIGWPWCDELVAVYGKMQMARRSGAADVEMFVDATPGTPPLYRREAFARLFGVGYDVADNVFFGTDSQAPDYNAAWAREWIDRDTAILREVAADSVPGIFETNLRRFLAR